MADAPAAPGAVPSLSTRQRWAAIAQGMQQDMTAYAHLCELLHTQFHAALRHDAEAMQEAAVQITAQVQWLEGTRKERGQHVRALLPAGAPLSMEAAFALLQAPLQQQLLGLWGQLEAQVQVCKAMNQRNCQLIMEQAEVMRAVIVGNAQPEIYAPL
ncbi:flagellar export chaperone FlgN [Comamonas sp. 17RB]|uniref:flagellar export chaperone FlgN n=1 Tax=Comamonas sp. 17RB TaxID=3047025 RepID=UPI0024B795DB|nr:flagellar export chaperone FlgN [Comamonas sp. 17RB]MDI9856428.1 flagellar export chaperone FlgN [Comamonas sp. 17RB]